MAQLCQNTEDVRDGQWRPSSLSTPPCCSSDNLRSRSRPAQCSKDSQNLAPRGVITSELSTERLNVTTLAHIGHGACSPSCSDFNDGSLEWVPRTCALPQWDARRFCTLLGQRRLLLVGDSTMEQTGSALVALVQWGHLRDGGVAAGNASCHRQISIVHSDTLIARHLGRFNRGIFGGWLRAVARFRRAPGGLLVVLHASAHVYGSANFSALLSEVAAGHTKRFPDVPLLWKTSAGAGCDAHPHDGPPPYAAPYWDALLARTSTWNWPELWAQDELARRFWAHHHGACVLDMAPLHRRIDARVASPHGVRGWDEWNETKPRSDGFRDCLHLCGVGVHRLFARLLLRQLLLGGPCAPSLT